ncbi:MAG TPA: Gfo/Idh/MocA family oxidoreductase [Sedimentisphaerales bacterium]|nr:Gfo/Idh/MocA family oxidoreductase [Sedimentisphaerales bacterium]HRS11318.1 Gfo/Idh/MocA family oxidoreductase [Sedimentisphaerales bacterium]HRV47890.1 Gfo/Idh/MocA family oxidoreductase [Sedimentisphaerales bacterium]
MSDLNRRDFIRMGAVAGMGASLTTLTPALAGAGLFRSGRASLIEFKVPPIENVRIGYVGVGGMGSAHVRNLLKIEGCQITAVCDIVPEKVERVQKWVEEAGFPKPTGYTRGDWDFKRLCETEDLDLVYTATPWEWHTPVLLEAMKNGKHGATEVNAAFSIEDCWKLVETAEKTQRHCVLMENCCYDRTEMQILNMVKQGLFGELIHGECGYLHDLRGVKFSEGGEGLWRRNWAMTHDCNLYPTHGLGPIAQCMDINRGDAFDYLVSVSSNSRGLYEYAERLPADDPRRKETYKLGDVNTSIIRTKLGKTIIVKHDTNLPRPYSRDILVQGTKGIVRKYPEEKVHIEGKTQGHDWEDLSRYRSAEMDYDHPLWKAMQERAKGAGHGGMDFIEDFRLIEALRMGRPTDIDVYDAVAWSAVVGLSRKSVAKKGKPVDFPDFTRGQWKNPRELHVMEFKG